MPFVCQIGDSMLLIDNQVDGHRVSMACFVMTFFGQCRILFKVTV